MPAAPARAAAPATTEPVDTLTPATPSEPETTTAAAPESAPSTGDRIYDEMVKEFTARFQQGQLLFNRGSYAQAAIEFEAAFAAVPAAAALSNVALAYERAGDHVAAARAAKRYLDLPACDTPGVDEDFCASQRAELAEALDRLLKQTGELRLQRNGDVRLREVRIDGRVIAQQDFPLLVEPGRHEVELVGSRKDERLQRMIDVRAGESRAIVVEPFASTPSGDRGTDPQRRRDRSAALRPTFWAAVALTAASAATLASFGTITVVQKRRYEEDPPTPPYPAGAEDRFGTFKTASNAMVGVTAGLAMVTVVVGLFAFSRPRNRSTTRASTHVHWLGTGVRVRW
ncbi:MAG: hypothetical protein K1X88_05420 [Nannocystaceae bacterium]|nr:hypothetical protein [Nannocystaceae bacterium]